MTDLTPSQTVGPFLHIGLPWADGPFAVPDGTPGAITITGRVTDGDGTPLSDAMIETWQADAEPQRGFDGCGFARCATDADGGYRIVTVLPPAQPDRNGATEAPHIDVAVFSRGLLNHLVTRIYFAGVEENTTDPVLRSIDPARRGTLIAAEVPGGYLFDIRLQGTGETVFFDV